MLYSCFFISIISAVDKVRPANNMHLPGPFDCLMGMEPCIFTANESWQKPARLQFRNSIISLSSSLPLSIAIPPSLSHSLSVSAACTSSRLIKACIINITIFKSFFPPSVPSFIHPPQHTHPSLHLILIFSYDWYIKCELFCSNSLLMPLL